METKKKETRPPLLIHPAFESMLIKQSDTDRGKLFTALMAYQWHGIEPKNLSDRIHGIFETLKAFADSDNEKYQLKKQIGRDSVMKRWNKDDANNAQSTSRQKL